MAIAFARLEFVKRSSGKNACGKAAYNSRSRILFHGSQWQEARTYDWTSRAPPSYHEVLLPDGVGLKFKSPDLLWNAVEQKEVRRNSQSAFEMVLALPDDKVISLDDKKYLTRTFIEEHFIKHGVAAQIDVHAPEAKQVENQVYETADHNWHAHILITTRRFKENGLELDDHKARDLMPVVKGGRVISGEHWGKLWAQHQNAFFEQKGLSLRVDAEGVVAQKHLGPARMRARAFSLLDEHELRVSLNALEAEDPVNVLGQITQTKNIFTAEDVDQFLHKHADSEKVFAIREAFWKQNEIVQLLDPKSNKPLNKFTTREIIEEEKRMIRLGDRLEGRQAHRINLKKAEAFASNLPQEQKAAFHHVITGKRLACIEGHAGTGKSHLLAGLKDAYESNGYLVRGLGPDSATAQVLKEKRFTSAENIYRFLFSLHNAKLQISKKEVWILDEAGKLGTRPLLELLKYANRYGAQLILSGDSAQLPSVERGIGFKLFSEMYGTQHLENIQRQKEEVQREIAKKLARGEMGEALDAILRIGSIRWAASKEEAIEKLITAWATNKLKNPNESTLIIAHSNREVRALNELVRAYRKEVGELQGKEYRCETAFGKIYVAVGDRIEFRKKDAELGVSNGTEGVLIKASEKRFTVQIKENDQMRHVDFDPHLYRTFQLGYATTYFRSQGRAAERAYVLHSPMMNKEMFYVGLTRHAKKVECFVSQQEAKNLSDLKRQAYRQTFKASTLEYSTYYDLEQQEAHACKQHRLAALKSSDSLLFKAKALGISIFDKMRTQVSKLVESHKDKQPDPAFFNPKIEKESLPGKVEEVQFEEEIKIDEKIRLQLQDRQQDLPISKTKGDWKKLSEEKKSTLRAYFRSVDKASSLYTIVKSEEESSGCNSIHFQEWQKACGIRNSRAFEVSKCLKSKELRLIFGTKGLEILQERAAKHEIELQRKENSLVNLDADLKENLQSLLSRLFPEGPTKRSSKGLRFGSKGSMAVTLTGEKAGSFYDFERQEGGGPLHLIQRSLSCTHAEAISWAKEFLGKAPTLQVPSNFKVKNSEKEQEWVSLKPAAQQMAPALEEISKNFLANYYKETARYAYRDTEGQILFYTLRLQDAAGKKIILPLSYGNIKGNDEAPSWSLKGYQAEKKPLYNLHLLKEFPTSKVLLVEGEKTAEAASKKFPKEKMICLTWSGGAGAVNKSDWHSLFMREVIIWPDNDKAGFEASESICRELRKIGIKSLHEVDRETLAKELPPKWDLADSLPQGKGETFIKDMILRSHEKALGLQALITYLTAYSISINTHIANEILSTIENRMRPSLEQKFGHKTWEVNSVILKETMQILKDPSCIRETLNTQEYQKYKIKTLNIISENRDIGFARSQEKELES
jgi:Ti-type conjugative transfer relaxase TraA